MTHQEFKQLPKPEHDLFIVQLLYAIHHNATCFSYAAVIIKLANTWKDVNKMYQYFLGLDKIEHDEMISQLLQNINQNADDFNYAYWVVQAAETTGLFNGVTFNHPAPDMITAEHLS
jgi:hypothetical protein